MTSPTNPGGRRPLSPHWQPARRPGGEPAQRTGDPIGAAPGGPARIDVVAAGGRPAADIEADLPAPILPPATIGILGGGQLGRMIGFAARQLGYRILVLDPDPDCPAAAVADRVEMGAYHDVDAALRLADRADVITYELEHVALGVVEAVAARRPVRPGRLPLQVTQDRLAERAFLERIGVPVAPYRVVSDQSDLASAAFELDLPLRLKAPTGGYDGRSQIRIAAVGELADAIDRLGRPAGEHLLLEKELPFEMELSVVIARGVNGLTAPYPVGRNVHDRGILVESVAPAPIAPAIATTAQALVTTIAEGVELEGVMTAELFLMPDGSLVVNELAPRVHNSGHWTIEAAVTSQFEQHVRAICGLPLGRSELRAPAATVNLLGTGRRRTARLSGIDEALRAPDVHLHVYDKQEVFERRKMGHLTALGATVEEALERARAARAALEWMGEQR